MLQQWPITIPALTGDEPRSAYVYVPDGALADPARRYPVLYMFDGQNLFRDADASYGKCWGMLAYLAAHNVPLIVAAIECNHHAEAEPCGGRLSEYSPFDFSDGDWGEIRGRGQLTMEYLVNQFKPYVDTHYPAIPDREHTFIGGSSMGGLMTLYALLAYNGVFSRGAALSPSLGFSPNEIKELIRRADIRKTVLYMDCGAGELRRARERRLFGDIAARLIRKGVLLESRVVPDGIHSESAWEEQIPFFLGALFYHL